MPVRGDTIKMSLKFSKAYYLKFQDRVKFFPDY